MKSMLVVLSQLILFPENGSCEDFSIIFRGTKAMLTILYYAFSSIFLKLCLPGHNVLYLQGLLIFSSLDSYVNMRAKT